MEVCRAACDDSTSMSDLNVGPMTADSPLGRIVRGTGPGLLLAHGAGGGVQPNFGPILDGLAEHHTVVGPDYPGTGRTPAPPRR